MKKPSNKAKAVYLAWVFLHLTLWAIARNTPGSKSRFFPLPHKGWGNWELLGKQPIFREYSETMWFQINKVYDITEFVFYSIAPIVIYYIIQLFNSKDTTDN
jgi:hypothetical protein